MPRFNEEVKRLKIGLDIHGVIDQAPELFQFFGNHPKQFEVHIITGIKQELDDVVDFPFDHWFSIHQQCEDEGIAIQMDDQNRPWVDPALWDTKKAEYCEREGIHMMIDDSPSYGEFFQDLSTLYLRFENTERSNWRKDGSRVEDGKVYFAVPEVLVNLGRAAIGLWDAGVILVKCFADLVRPVTNVFSNLYKSKIRPFFKMPSVLYSYDKDVEAALQDVIDNYKFVSADSYYATFKNGDKTASIWIANLMYGMASRGEVDGFTWNGCQASRKTCVALYDIVDEA